MWLETYVSSMIRAILYADDESYRITGYRRLNPIPNQSAERRFLDAAERLFSSGIADFMTRLMEGWQLGSEPEIQVANIATNHLTTALMKYFAISGRWEQGINLFHKLREQEPEVDLLLAQLFLEMGFNTFHL
jgi:Chs5-Arf1p-binding protein BUD7/BCH1